MASRGELERQMEENTRLLREKDEITFVAFILIALDSSSAARRAYEMDIATLQKESAESARKSREQMLANLKAKVSTRIMKGSVSLCNRKSG